MRRWRRLSSRPECPLAGPPPQDRLPGTREVHARSCWLAQGDHSFSGDGLGQPDAVAAGLAHVGWCISRSTVAVARVLGISSSNPEYGSFLCTAGRVREGRQCRGVRGRQHGSARQRVYDHYLAELASTGPADLNVCSFSLVGPRNRVDKITRKLHLLPRTPRPATHIAGHGGRPRGLCQGGVRATGEA